MAFPSRFPCRWCAEAYRVSWSGFEVNPGPWLTIVASAKGNERVKPLTGKQAGLGYDGGRGVERGAQGKFRPDEIYV